MRGVRVSKAARKDFDLIVIAARYRTEDGLLDIAQVYERSGPIWGDVKLLNRSQLSVIIKSGRRVVIGRLSDLQGDFEVLGQLKLVGNNGSETLVVGDSVASHDELQVPLF